MEHVEVPKFIPAKEADWFSRAVVAYQSGQELAALFLLRTFIEQFARRLTGSTPLRGEDLMTEYTKPLPTAMKDSFPSLRKVYEAISVALHEANPTKAPFEVTLREVERHFEARRLFEVQEAAGTPNPVQG